MKTFTSTTSWQCDPDWNIEINVRGFRTAKDAALFGMGNGPYSAKKLLLENGQMIIRMGAGPDLTVRAENVVVARLKDDSHGKTIWDMDDFVVVNIKPAQFHTEPGLSSGFSSLSFGVRDEEGNPVEVRLAAHDVHQPEYLPSRESGSMISLQ